MLVWCNLEVLAIGLCAGVAFTFLSNAYLAHNERVKTEGQRNTVYTTTCLIIGFFKFERIDIIESIFYKFIKDPIWNVFGG